MSEKEDNEKKEIGTLDKILLGVVIGGAVGSVVGATISNKELRDKMREKIAKTSDTLKEIVDGSNNTENKKSFWHFLNKLFFKSKK